MATRISTGNYKVANDGAKSLAPVTEAMQAGLLDFPDLDDMLEANDRALSVFRRALRSMDAPPTVATVLAQIDDDPDVDALQSAAAGLLDTDQSAAHELATEAAAALANTTDNRLKSWLPNHRATVREAATDAARDLIGEARDLITEAGLHGDDRDSIANWVATSGTGKQLQAVQQLNQLGVDFGTVWAAARAAATRGVPDVGRNWVYFQKQPAPGSPLHLDVRRSTPHPDEWVKADYTTRLVMLARHADGLGFIFRTADQFDEARQANLQRHEHTMRKSTGIGFANPRGRIGT